MKLFKLSLSLALILTNTGCMPGSFQFDYYWNPANVTQLALEALETGDTSNWMDLFTSQAMCLYGNEKGYLALRKTLGPKPESYRSSYTVSDSRMTQTTSQGESTRELYELTIVRASNATKVFTIQMVCHQAPSSHFCRIYNLVDHVNGAPDQGGACADLRGTID